MDKSADISPEMIVIPAGYVPSGSNGSSRYAGKEVASFELAKYAVTNQLWKSVMDFIPDSKFNKLLDHPVVNVSWYNVQEFLENLNKQTKKQYRLPTELEWEYAARASTIVDYHCDRKSLFQTNIINFNKNRAGPVPVNSLPANPWGLYEMLGNVWEWVDAGRTVPGIGNIKDHELRVLRGGCWASHESDVTLTARAEHQKSEAGWNTFGFRVAKKQA